MKIFSFLTKSKISYLEYLLSLIVVTANAFRLDFINTTQNQLHLSKYAQEALFCFNYSSKKLIAVSRLRLVLFKELKCLSLSHEDANYFVAPSAIQTQLTSQ